jgi:hypothetical protein
MEPGAAGRYVQRQSVLLGHSHRCNARPTASEYLALPYDLVAARENTTSFFEELYGIVVRLGLRSCWSVIALGLGPRRSTGSLAQEARKKIRKLLQGVYLRPGCRSSRDYSSRLSKLEQVFVQLGCCRGDN